MLHPDLKLPPYHGSFGAKRKHDIHTGVDLCCPEHTKIYSPDDGELVEVGIFTGPDAGSPWWNPTGYCVIRYSYGAVLFGEINPETFPSKEIKKCQLLGTVQTVLKHNKGLPTSMLHVELYSKYIEPAIWYHNNDCPHGLIDPSNIVSKILNLRDELTTK